MNFYPYGPFSIPKQINGLIDRARDSIRNFWVEVDNAKPGLSNAIGIYIFSIRAGRGVLPWYVGKAEKRGFIRECFAPHKITHYDNCIASRKGTPLLTFIAKLTPNDSLVGLNGDTHRDISALEKMLIGTCLQKNKNLVNVRDTRLFREMVVPGYLNPSPGRVQPSVEDFKKLIGQ
jgi:hypothetical protein